MKEKMIYIADDGREFDNREECEKYEKETDNTMDYIKFYDRRKNEIKLEPLDKHSFIQYCKYGQTERYNCLTILLDDVFFIHVSKNIPTQEEEKQVEDFLFQICNEFLPEIRRFDFKKGITYYYDEEIECFTNTVYERKKLKAQTEFLNSLDNLE